MKHNEIYYCILTDKICVIVDFDVWSNQTRVIYIDDETFNGKYVSSRIVSLFWKKLGVLK